VDRATPALAAHLRDVARRFAEAGATIAEVGLPAEFAALHAAGQVVLEVEAAAYHAETFARHAPDYGKGIAELIRAGLARPATEYVTANRARLAFRAAVTPLLAAHDALLAPTAPGPAPPGLGWTGDATLCAPWSSAGAPAISLPSGIDGDGLPWAVQLVQAPGASARLLAAAAWCERVLGFRARPGA
jgi:Asp-tRNA(Asn)/Glu-tRNA(Gln) amidotransferase A subunit family amidase